MTCYMDMDKTLNGKSVMLTSGLLRVNIVTYALVYTAVVSKKEGTGRVSKSFENSVIQSHNNAGKLYTLMQERDWPQ